MKKVVLIILSLLSLTAMATERTILVGPKTIGRGWQDNIVLETRHFAAAKAGDVLTVYVDRVRPSAQMAMQRPSTWSGITAAYSAMPVTNPMRLTITDEMLPVLREEGLRLGGHDYRICSVSLTDAEDYKETIVWKGPAVTMADNWSVSAELMGSCFRDLQEGDGIVLHVSHVKDGAKAKLSDITWNPICRAADGMDVAGEGVTLYLTDMEPLIHIGLGGTGTNTALRIGGIGYRLEKVGIVRCTAEPDMDLSAAQRAPKEYRLRPGELFRGEKAFASDWSDNLKITAQHLQDMTINDVIIFRYDLVPEAPKNEISIRRTETWGDVGAGSEPQFLPLDGTDYVMTMDSVTLDHIKTRGFIVTAAGIVLKRVLLLKTE